MVYGAFGHWRHLVTVGLHQYGLARSPVDADRPPLVNTPDLRCTLTAPANARSPSNIVPDVNRSQPLLTLATGASAPWGSARRGPAHLRYGHLAPEHLRTSVARLDSALPVLAELSAQASAPECVTEGALLSK